MVPHGNGVGRSYHNGSQPPDDEYDLTAVGDLDDWSCKLEGQGADLVFPVELGVGAKIVCTASYTIPADGKGWYAFHAHGERALFPGHLGHHGAGDVTGDGTTDVADLLVVGAGPGGLAAAVYGASEGLRTRRSQRAGRPGPPPA